MNTEIKVERIETPRVRSADEWFSIITGLKPKDFLPARRGTMFAPRSRKFPI